MVRADAAAAPAAPAAPKKAEVGPKRGSTVSSSAQLWEHWLGEQKQCDYGMENAVKLGLSPANGHFLPADQARYSSYTIELS